MSIFQPPVVTLYQASSALQPGTSATVGTVSSVIISVNQSRYQVWICNTDASAIVYLSLGGTAVVNKGIVIYPKTTFQVQNYAGAISAISSAANTNVAIAEI